MHEGNVTPGLGERVLREILATPALKEVILLQMKDIRPETAPGLVKTFLWGDPGISMSLFGAIPDALNWLLELLLELGRQLNGLPEPLLKDILGRIGSGIDRERLGQFPEVYGKLLRRLVIGEGRTPEEVRDAAIAALNSLLAALDRATARLEENREEIARSLARSWKEMDTASLARTLRRLSSLAVVSARTSREGREGRASKIVVTAAVFIVLFLAFRLAKRRASAIKRH